MMYCKICGKKACAGCAEYYDDQIDALGKEIAEKNLLIAKLVSAAVKAAFYLDYNSAAKDISDELKELIKEAA